MIKFTALEEIKVHFQHAIVLIAVWKSDPHGICKQQSSIFLFLLVLLVCIAVGGILQVLVSSTVAKISHCT
jgi:hypothetical protein